MTSKEEQPQNNQRRQRQQQQDLDSILDAALDELEEDSDDNDDADNNNVVEEEDEENLALNQNLENTTNEDVVTIDGSFSHETTTITTGGTMGVPYSLEYLANNPAVAARTFSTTSSFTNRPKFGPPPPPINNDDNFFSYSSEEEANNNNNNNLAASLENMMKQLASGFDYSAGFNFNNNNDDENNDTTTTNNNNNSNMASSSDSTMKDLEHAEKALEEMFQKIMMMEDTNNNYNHGGGGGGMSSMPLTSSNTTDNHHHHHDDYAGGATTDGQSKKKMSSKSSSINSGKSNKNNQGSNINNKETKKNDKKKEPNVDESINRLLDGISQASSSSSTHHHQQPQPKDGIPLLPNNIDPSQLEHLSEQMMGSLMHEFEQFNMSPDSNDVVDSVMKQLLDKELMYEPMKEVCTRYPKWLASNKDKLSMEEYQKYGTQYQYFQRIVRLYETDPGNFDRLMELMQDIQEYGQPPVEIIKELAPELKFDEEGMPIMDPMGISNNMGGSGGMMMPGMMPGMPFPMGGPNGEQCCIS
ncbi:hypothetical protein ACHAXM_001997 [Skeletonema potamos]